ncbi:MAG TPA: type I-B CRISPR-associated protein Cas5 [Thermoanaerobacterales bacterium]|nr:type I-B CRISPR-associated protein Cas5 [Thermoanaerobacterales bacterium]
MKTLVFDIYGDFGHFKKFYTTSSPLTFAFPPPPTVRGMLGAIVGCDKSEYLDIFSHKICKIAVRILNPVKKTRMGLNHINTKGNYWVPIKKGSHEARTQIRTEFLKDPSYRLYVAHEDDETFNKLIRNIRQHKTVFTLSLGLSELLADFKYVDVLDFREIRDVEKKIVSVVPLNIVHKYGTTFEEGKKYFKEKIAVEMTPERIVERYEDILYEVQGKPIKARVKSCWEGENGDHIAFF